MRSYGLPLYLCLILNLFGRNTVLSFTTTTSRINEINSSSSSSICKNVVTQDVRLNMAPKDPSRSGTKKERMNKLAEMEKMGKAENAGDNGIFVKAAGGFVFLIIIALAFAEQSGLMTPNIPTDIF